MLRIKKASLLILSVVGAFFLSHCHTSDSQQSETPKSETKPQSVIKNARNELSKLARKGQALFQRDCSTCHSMAVDKIEGPTLKGYTKRLDKAWTKRFLDNPNEIFSNDKRMQALLQRFQYRVMPAFHYNDQEMDALWAYLEEAGN
ncbi:MAG: cytochrome c [Microscillaceae bacterium]|nr:cytochrome c [Microscillaceae bacterium]